METSQLSEGASASPLGIAKAPECKTQGQMDERVRTYIEELLGEFQLPPEAFRTVAIGMKVGLEFVDYATRVELDKGGNRASVRDLLTLYADTLDRIV